MDSEALLLPQIFPKLDFLSVHIYIGLDLGDFKPYKKIIPIFTAHFPYLKTLELDCCKELSEFKSIINVNRQLKKIILKTYASDKIIQFIADELKLDALHLMMGRSPENSFHFTSVKSFACQMYSDSDNAFPFTFNQLEELELHGINGYSTDKINEIIKQNEKLSKIMYDVRDMRSILSMDLKIPKELERLSEIKFDMKYTIWNQHHLHAIVEFSNKKTSVSMVSFVFRVTDYIAFQNGLQTLIDKKKWNVDCEKNYNNAILRLKRKT